MTQDADTKLALLHAHMYAMAENKLYYNHHRLSAEMQLKLQADVCYHRTMYLLFDENILNEILQVIQPGPPG